MGLDIKRPDCVAISISNLNLIAIIFISPSFIRVFCLTGTSMVHLMCKCPCKYDEIIVLTFPQWSQCLMLLLLICGGFKAGDVHTQKYFNYS